MFFRRSRHVVIFEHIRRSIQVVHTLPVNADTNTAASYKQAQQAIEATIARLRERNGSMPPLSAPAGVTLDESLVTSNMTPEQFLEAVREAKARLAAGDVFQVVLSQRFSVPWNRPPLQLYRALRSINPSPYMFF